MSRGSYVCHVDVPKGNFVVFCFGYFYETS
jgi:hypothetical protein